MSAQIKECALCKKPASEELKLKTCAGCGEVGYCTKEHQKDDWKEHKKVCKKKHIKKAAGDPDDAHLRKTDSAEIPVLWEDQQRINRFGRLNIRMTEIEDLLAIKKAALESVKDASGEIDMLLDDDCCKVRIGEMYVSVSNEEAEEFAAEEARVLQQEVADLESEAKGIMDEMRSLKALLYAKFGDQINLETERDRKE